MTCDDFARWIVSDDPEELQLAANHASRCPECATRQRDLGVLASLAAAWKAETPAPSPALRDRLLAAWRAGGDRSERSEPGPAPAGAATASAERPGPEAAPLAATPPSPPLPFHPAPRAVAHRGRLAAAALLAASLAAAVGILASGVLPGRDRAPESADRLLVEEALEEAEEARASHAQAIARLERAAAPLLARATDPATEAAEAGPLLAARDRLAALDAAIAEIETYLETNLAHPRARAMLLAAYIEKTEVLEGLLSRDHHRQESPS